MRIAEDKNGDRVFIESAHAKEDYFCPCCGEKLVIKKGRIRRHHFAHFSSSICSDHWHYDMSDWHMNWQNKFPKSVQEIVKQLNGHKHRADILIEECRTVIEFQHSSLDASEFEERNAFYNNLGYKVIWVFDVAEQYNSGAIEELERRDSLFKWKRPINTLNYYQYTPKVELFFQLKNSTFDDSIAQDDCSDGQGTKMENIAHHTDWESDGCLVKVSWVAPSGFERFAIGDQEYTTREFVMQFGKYVELNIGFGLSDVFDSLCFLYSRDHTQYFAGCPISKTGYCCNSIIDVPETQYDIIRPCELCPHRGYHEGLICYKRVSDLHLPSNTKIKCYEKRRDGSLKSLTYYEEETEKTISFSAYKTGETIIEIWNKEQPRIATFRNTKTGYFIRIYRNPLESLSKYGKCYGKVSKDQYHFPEQSSEIYGYDKPEWIIVWSKKD